jgi:hypothetical protein
MRQPSMGSHRDFNFEAFSGKSSLHSWSKTNPYKITSVCPVVFISYAGSKSNAVML